MEVQLKATLEFNNSNNEEDESLLIEDDDDIWSNFNTKSLNTNKC